MHQNDVDFKKNALRIGAALLLFIALFYTLIGYFYWTFDRMLVDALGEKIGDVLSQILYGVLYLAIFMVPALMHYFLSRKDTKEIQVKRSLAFPDTIIMIFAAISIIFSAAYINSWLTMVFDITTDVSYGDSPTTFVGFLLLTFKIAIVPAVCEEFLFRKTILRSLLPYGEGFAIVTSAVMFGIMHQNILQVFYAVMAGVVLGFVYAKTRSYMCVFLIHFINNFISVLQEAVITNMPEPYASFIAAIIVATVFILGIISLVILMVKEKNKSDAFDTGSFEKILLPDSNYQKKTTTFNCAKKLFLSPCVLIFTILCVALCAYTAFI